MRKRDIEEQSGEESENRDSLYDVQENSTNFKQFICDFECAMKVTLEKQKNNKHGVISRLGLGTFRCSILVREGMDLEAKIMRRTSKEKSNIKI